MKKTYYKVIKSSDNHYEVYSYEREPFNPHLRDFKYDSENEYFYENEKPQEEIMPLSEEEKEQLRLKRKKQTLRDTRNTARRMALANFTHLDKFITIHFDDKKINFNPCNDIKRADQEFRNFMARLKRYLKKKDEKDDIKYLAVREFQERGAVHYHILLSHKGFIPFDDLLKLWGKGGCWINALTGNEKSVDNVGAYMVKYMSKSLEDDRLDGFKKIIPSRNLIRPQVFKGNAALELIHKKGLGVGNAEKRKDSVFENGYTSEYQGACTYQEYNLLRNKSNTIKLED